MTTELIKPKEHIHIFNLFIRDIELGGVHCESYQINLGRDITITMVAEFVSKRVKSIECDGPLSPRVFVSFCDKFKGKNFRAVKHFGYYIQRVMQDTIIEQLIDQE